MTTSFFLAQDINFTVKLGVRSDATFFSDNLTTLEVVFLKTTHEETNVVTSTTFVEQLTEHLDVCNRGKLGVADTDNFNFFHLVNDTTLNPTGSNGATTFNGEHVFDRHEEVKINGTLRLRNVAIYSIHQLKDVCLLLFVAFSGPKSGTHDNRNVVTRVVIHAEKLTNFHFNKLKKLVVVNLVSLVHEYNKCRNANLTGKQDVLTSLRHWAVRSGYHEDTTVHLGSTCNHVLYVVGVTWAVNVCVVTLSGLILNVCCRNSNTTLALFRRSVDFVVCLSFATACFSKNVGDNCGKSCFSVVNVTDGADVYVRLSPFKCFFSHDFVFGWCAPPIDYLEGCWFFLLGGPLLAKEANQIFCFSGLELLAGIEPATSSLPRTRSTPELQELSLVNLPLDSP